MFTLSRQNWRTNTAMQPHNKKIFNLFLALILMFSFINATDFPIDASAEIQQQWVIQNPEDFNPSNSAQAQALVDAYKNKRIDFDNKNNKGAVEKYLQSQEGGIKSSDRSILNDLVAHEIGSVDNLVSHEIGSNVRVDLSKGEKISFVKDNEKSLLVTSDGKKHDVAAYGKFLSLDKIQSKDDGTIELIFGDDSINLKGTTLARNTLGQFVLEDGSILNLKGKFGKLLIDGTTNQISCNSVLCDFSENGININLNSEGSFQNLGGKRFSIVDGIVKFEKDSITGSAEFSINSQGNRIDFSKKINLRTFSVKNQALLGRSFVTIDEGFGDVEISTSSSIKKTLSNVVVCVQCNDFSKQTENYDGYVDFRNINNEKFDAEIKGQISAKFEDDFQHIGENENLLASYNNGGIFKLKSCAGCKNENVGMLLINDRPFRISSLEGNSPFNFDLKELNPAFPINKDYSRSFYVVDENAKTANLYLIKSSGPILLERIRQTELDEYANYNNMIDSRESKINGFCGQLSLKECQEFKAFSENLKNGLDGEIIEAVTGGSLGR